MPANTALREPATSDERTAARDYRELVNSLDDVVFRFDQRGCWSFLSPAWERSLGWKTGACLGRAAAKFVHPEERAHILQRWSRVQSGAESVYRRETRFRQAGGGYRWMLVSARGLHDETGALRGVTGTLTDVSAAKAVEHELHAARSAAEAANKAKSEFLSTMSHELRTPLNAVIGLSESLLEAGAPFEPARTARYLGIIQASGKQLLAQINDILDLARIEAGRIRVNAEPFDLGALCASTLDIAQREIRGKQLAAKLDRPAGPLVVNGDERLLRQVLQNLISNAVKFTPARGHLAISLTRGPEGKVRLAVSDSGIGIAPEKLAELFRPFSQIDASLSRHFGGTGLGLALVERLVRLHGGAVSVQSEVSRGSTFIVELPGSIVVDGRAGPSRGLLRSRRIVLVDDDPRQHVLVGDYLQHRGFEIVHCETGAAALAEIAATEPGLAIVDINMPGMSGLDLIPRLRALPHGKDLPILAVTALAEPDEAQRCRAAGANSHLPKPISLVALTQRVADLTGLTA